MYEHLMSRIPNNFISQWMLKKVKQRIVKSKSNYRLRIRYRNPIEGKHYDRGGGLRREHAKTFSIYITSKYRRSW